jgi:ubiquitin-like 1-activating enzyme E1 B
MTQVFLSQFINANRLLSSDKSSRPNPDCPVCGAYQASISVDLSRATLEDLVESFLRVDLGYGEKDIVVNNDVGTLYDVDEQENLSRTFSDLGKTSDSRTFRQ